VIENKDSKAGLIVQDRNGKNVRIRMNDNQIAIQIGETTQVLSGGELIATRHCVKSSKIIDVSRSTMAVFLQPNWNSRICLPNNIKLENCKVDHFDSNGMTFEEFSKKKFGEYYLGKRKHIFISGADSTGKTTLCNAFKKNHQNFYLVEEIGRKLLKEKKNYWRLFKE